MSVLSDLKVLTGKSNAPEGPVLPRKKILIVEDELSLAEALSMALKSAGYDVFQARYN